MSNGKGSDKGKLERRNGMAVCWGESDCMSFLEPKKSERAAWSSWLPELCGIAVLAALLAYFLRMSWRKWPDPIVDSGAQWYAAWRISQGESLAQEAAWNYGPLSAYFNGWLFRIFGATLNVLFAANLLIYGGILGLAYAAFRRAWGRLGAFAACGVFIAVFSFSHLTSIGNYNYAAPYSHESTHGMLLMFGAIFIAASWSRKESRTLAFFLGTCGGMAAVLKPEIMLAAGALGAGALALRLLQRKSISGAECALLAAGVAWPTLLFAVIFSAREPLGGAFAEASNGWWRVLVKPIELPGFATGQAVLAGFDHPWRNGWVEIQAGVCALVVLAAIWAVGWFINRPSSVMRIVLVLVLGALALCIRLDGGWFRVGRCLPLLAVMILVLTGGRLLWEWRQYRKVDAPAVMQWMLALLAVAMLARMALFARVYHFGFFQAAPAAMVIAAVMTAEIPRWAGKGRAGVALSAACGLSVLALGCASIAARSNAIRAEQTQPVGAEPDRFYAFNREVDPIGPLVNWVVKRLSADPPGGLLVLPDGLSINYLTRRVSVMPSVGGGGPDELRMEALQRSPPEYVVLISLNLAEHGVQHYGKPGNPGYLLLRWVKQNYTEEASWGEPFSGTSLKGARILRRKDF
jgi:hypothetical protein